MTWLLNAEGHRPGRRTAVTPKNEYEPAAVVEIGQAHDVILGCKCIVEEENGTGDPLRFPSELAKFDE